MKKRIYATLLSGDYRTGLWMEMFGTSLVPLYSSEAKEVAIGDTKLLCFLVNISALGEDQYRIFTRWRLEAMGANPAEAARYASKGFYIQAQEVVVVEFDEPEFVCTPDPNFKKQ